MRMIISMKIINCSKWAPRNRLNIPIPITDPSVDLQVLLAVNLYVNLYKLVLLQLTQ